MRGIIFVDRVKSYGAERVAWSVAEGLAEDHDMTLVTFSRQAPEEHPTKGFGYRKVGQGSGSYFRQIITTLKDLRRLVRETETDVVISFMPTANVLACIALAGLPVKTVITEHNVPASLGLVGVKSVLHRVILTIFYRLADSIVTVSDAVREHLAAFMFIEQQKIQRIYNPIDYADILQRSAQPLLLPPDEEPDQVRLLMVGRFKPAKGHEYAVEALALLPEKFSLYLVGDGELESDLEALARRLGVRGRVHFLGFHSNPYQWMRWADVLLVPSRWEGFGLVLAEASGVGIPAVASDVPALAEVAALTGATVVPVGDVQAISEACGKLGRKSKLTPTRVPEFEVQNVISQYSSEMTKVLCGR